jgi:ribosome-binding factor A
MVTFRIERLNKEFLRLIADFLMNGLKDETAAGVILTHVDCSKDLSHAKVYFTLLDEGAAPAARAALESSAGKIRGYLGRAMRVRQIPELHFIFDDSERRAREIDALIDRVIQEDRGRGKCSAE